jgi:hypothetical protein
MAPLVNMLSRNRGSRTLVLRDPERKPLGQNPPTGPKPATLRKNNVSNKTANARNAAYTKAMYPKYNAKRLINNNTSNKKSSDNWSIFKSQKPSFNQFNPMIYKTKEKLPVPILSGGKTRKNRHH